MIVRSRSGGTLLVRQTDHAHLAGVFAKALSTAPEPRGLFETAVREHDLGWEHYDQAPGINTETGLPYSFRDTPQDPYQLAWQTGLDRAYRIDPYVGILIASHGLPFFAGSKRAQSEAFLHDGLRRIDETLDALGLRGSWDALPDEAQVHVALLRFLDGLSLFICDGWASPWTTTVLDTDVTVTRAALGPGREDGVPARERIVVDPWPFAQAIEYHVPARWLTGGPFRTEADLHAAMAAAPLVSVAGIVTRAAGVDQ